jgi:UDP-glucose 4-epimerase
VDTSKRASFTTSGDDLPTSDVARVRDYVPARDIANAHVPALASQEVGQHDIVNLGNCSGFSVQDVPEGVRNVTRHLLPTKMSLRRTGALGVHVASNERARTHPVWIPEDPFVTIMVENAWRFVSEGGA